VPDPRAEATALAASHLPLAKAPSRVTRLFEVSPFPKALERARQHLTAPSSDPAVARATEWFLDNYYFLRRVARQVAEELPIGFLRRLPRLATREAAGLPRVDALARAILARESSLDGRALESFIEAYQEKAPLRIAELWALPTVLRAAALRELLSRLAALDVPVERRQKPRPPAPGTKASGLEATGVERAIRALRLFAEIDWKAFFEKASRVESILRKDPAGVYVRMDFDTCDSYRKSVEDLAWGTESSETEVADLAVHFAEEAPAKTPESHVGYYLVGAGRSLLEGRIGYLPSGLERVRRALQRWPTLGYLGPLVLLMAIPLVVEGIGLRDHLARPGLVALALLVSAIPVSVVAIAMLHWILARVLPPRALPKLDFSKGIPRSARTAVVMPTLLGRKDDVKHMLRQVELHYLANPDPELQFALLTDHVDSVTGDCDEALLQAAVDGIAALNEKHGKEGSGPFHLLHRTPKWNPSEERFMGWERKRGKLLEFNRLLRGDTTTSYVLQAGDRKKLEDVSYVITLDSDTQLPMGSAVRLVGLFAHPLNRATFDERTGRVVSGYTIVQPRVETSPASVRATPFSRVFSGDVGYDIYTHACSDVYQDLFGAGIYVGKGIYEIDSFMRSVDGKVPENAIASHDLFEGAYGRAALATDIVLFESFPSHYGVYARRMHRWVRGDWQLLRWLLPKVPSSGGSWVRNQLSAIDRWKIVDNLRRSLTAPAFVAFFVSAWTWLPGNSLAWTIAGLLLLLMPALPGLMSHRRERADSLQRWGFALTFLAHEAAVVIDAMVRVLVRTFITKKKLLEWTSAAHTAFGVVKQSPRALLWAEMTSSPILALVVGVIISLVRPAAVVAASPLLLLWFVAPEIARWASQVAAPRLLPVTEPSRRRLRRLARRTWLFFEAFVGPHDQWLPIDNYQEQPHQQTAHRTSPTNIGMLLLSTLSAYDLGYLGPTELVLRLRRSFESIARLTHYQGHLLNWHDTTTLEPLLPRYVSTVDSGNFAGCLLALRRGCADVARARVIRRAEWDGLGDLLDLLQEAIADLAPVTTRPFVGVIERMRASLDRGRGTPAEAYAAMVELGQPLSKELDHELYVLLETGVYRSEPEKLRSLRMSIEHLHQQMQQMRREADTLLPWLGLKSDAEAFALRLPGELGLDQIPGAARSLIAQLDEWESARSAAGRFTSGHEASSQRLRQALQVAKHRGETLCAELAELENRAAEEVRGMDFRLLFDAERKLFHIGYNVTVDRVDANYYDLLASEARLASYLAIVKREVPESHWYALGRPMMGGPTGPALLSWGGTMFEYLMPALLMRSREGTLLEQTCVHVVDAQRAYAKENDAPWGISESAYARLDSHDTYQYQSFGVPGLGFKRGLEEDLVIAPYASLLAVSVRPHAVLENLTKLESMGMLGPYGMFESVDLQREHVEVGQPFAVVRSYMAHHQGMLLVALNNFLNRDVMVDRFHSDPMVETGEMLLNERPPAEAPAEWPTTLAADPAAPATATPVAAGPAPWSPASERSQAFALGNGRLTSLLTRGGGGGLLWQGLSLTRFQPDPSREQGGPWIFMRDEEDGHVWKATSSQGRTTFSLNKAEFHLREHGISVHVDVTVAPAEDVEVRLVTIRNETEARRRLTVTSAGEPTLLATREAAVHPAFSKMFVESEWDAELEGLIFSRRPRSADEEHAVVMHRLVRDGGRSKLVDYESDRAAFYGRGADESAPRALDGSRAGMTGRVGRVLDPIMSLTAAIDLKAKGMATLAFVTSVGASRGVAVDLAKRYGSMHAVRWTFRDAAKQGLRQLQESRLEPELVPVVQRLLSSLLFADRSLRAPASTLASGLPCKRKLWGKGISGDDPILLVRVDDSESRLVLETVAAQRYLRAFGIRFDLVFVDQKPSGYANEGSAALRAVLSRAGVDDWLNRHGGVFVLAADQLPAAEGLLLEASAKVVLDTRGGTLDAGLRRQVTTPPDLPRLEATQVADPSPSPLPVLDLDFDNQRGGFSKDGREYLIAVRPGEPTPEPWCNVLANAEFGALVSESALECTWSGNSGENRLTPWRNDPVFDTPSEVLYLRDEESAAVWSSTPNPAGRDTPTLVRHGAGYTKYAKESHGLEQELTVFVPPGESLKVVRLRLKNRRPAHRRLTATYYAEWVLGTQREEQRPYVTSEIDRPHGCLLARCTWNEEFYERVAFVASDRPVHGFTADRSEFLGSRGDYALPEALERWGLSGRVDAGVDPCAALQVHLELAPGEELEAHFVIGQAAGRGQALEVIERFRSAKAVDQAWEQLGSFWDSMLGSVRVKTPEPAMDLMLNRWLLYQTVSARFFGRTGFYQSSGAFGFRDQLQDVLALLHAAPERTRAHLLESAAHQFEEGDVLHWWHPPAGRGVRTRCSDDMAWLPFVTAGYVEATGDLSVLSEPVSFLTGPPLRADEHDRYAKFEAGSSATLFEHCRRALERSLTHGKHGLPLMGDGDWNDGMNQVGSRGVGESVWLGWFLVATLTRFAAVADAMKDTASSERWRRQADELRAAIGQHAWDGAWYLRAFHDDGSLVGSASARECRIDSIAQSWSALSGGENEARTRKALASADERLVDESERLVLLLTPPFDSTRHDPGYIQAYPPGIRENGGQYTHAATWLGCAYAAIGDGEHAERIFRLLNPVLRAKTAEARDRYRIEPYAIAGDIYSTEPLVGRGGWSWYTGAAAWMWRLGVEAILGLQKERGDLKIEPCIPPAWSGFEAWVKVGAKSVHVVVENPDGVSSGIASMVVDGTAVEPGRLRLNGKELTEVRVRLGTPRGIARASTDQSRVSSP
jgi:cyclic beta-1,2-glucan synthetase